MPEEKVYKPIDMDNYPYAAEDMLPGGIFIVKVIKGTAEDSQNGLIAHRIKGYEDDGATPILEEKPTIVKDRIDAMDVKKYKGKLLIVGVNPDPMAQMVFYQIRTEKKQPNGHWWTYSMRPDAFLKYAEKVAADVAAEAKAKK